MAVHGYRLHVIEGRLGRGHKPVPFAGDELSHALHDSLKLLEGATYLREAVYRTSVAAEEAPSEGDVLPARTAVLKINSVRRRDLSIEVEVGYGRTGEHGFLLGRDGEVQSIDGWAPANHYKVLFYCPREGERGVMVSSTTGRTHAGEMLLKRASVENAEIAASTAGDSWLKWHPSILVDDERINELIEGGAIEGITLLRKTHDKSGARTSRPVRLTQDGLHPEYRSVVRTMVQRWIRAQASGRSLSKPEEVAALTKLVDGDVSGLEFTDGVLAFTEIGKRQVVGPDKLGKILVYPVGNTPMTFDELHSKAGARLRRMAGPLGIPLDL